MTPGVSELPDSGNDMFACTAAAVPRANSGEDCLIRSRSWYAAEAAFTVAQSGFSAGFASSGCMYGHLAWLEAAGGSPWPKPVPVVQSQWMPLNQSPES